MEDSPYSHTNASGLGIGGKGDFQGKQAFVEMKCLPRTPTQSPPHQNCRILCLAVHLALWALKEARERLPGLRARPVLAPVLPHIFLCQDSSCLPSTCGAYRSLAKGIILLGFYLRHLRVSVLLPMPLEAGAGVFAL